MDTSWFLATEGGRVGLNFDILETNLINLSIVIVILVYFGKKFVGSTLTARKSSIEEAIQDAERRRESAAAALAEQQQQLAQAKESAKAILANAEENASKARESILAQAQADIARLRANAIQDLSSQQARVLRELQLKVVDLAIAKAEGELPNRLNDDIRQQLVDSSIVMLGNR